MGTTSHCNLAICLFRREKTREREFILARNKLAANAERDERRASCAVDALLTFTLTAQEPASTLDMSSCWVAGFAGSAPIDPLFLNSASRCLGTLQGDRKEGGGGIWVRPGFANT